MAPTCSPRKSSEHGWLLLNNRGCESDGDTEEPSVEKFVKGGSIQKVILSITFKTDQSNISLSAKSGSNSWRLPIGATGRLGGSGQIAAVPS